MSSSINISLIIPTHNRRDSLNRILKNLLTLKDETFFQIVVVDNNSSDGTVDLVKQNYKHVKYVFEKNTSFTKARKTGAENADGEIIIYLDDDVVLEDGCIDEVNKIFKEKKDCAVLGGRIFPLYEQKPPQWILDLQNKFNGFSTFDCGNDLKKVDAVPGPFMAIRKKVFDLVGGFSPDTVGVETNTAKKTFKKIYIGPGDYGFCLLCRQAGYKVFYSPKIKLNHVIPAFRLTKEFWISRMVGEGHCIAVSKANMDFYKKNYKTFNLKLKCIKHYIAAQLDRLTGNKSPLVPDDLYFEYYRSFIKMDKVMSKNPDLAKFIWQLGYDGVSDDNFDAVLKKLPKDYQNLAL
ncbi:glycosyltransferase [Candidatus Dependentiae bacterium]